MAPPPHSNLIPPTTSRNCSDFDPIQSLVCISYFYLKWEIEKIVFLSLGIAPCVNEFSENQGFNFKLQIKCFLIQLKRFFSFHELRISFV